MPQRQFFTEAVADGPYRKQRYNKNRMSKESDDDFCSPNPLRSLLAAPRRPEKKGDVQSVPVISIQSSSMCLESFEHKADSVQESSGKFDTCAVCSKNISHLDNLRKCAHVNRCLDTQESSNAYEKAKDKWNNVVDCPMCGEPQPPGPHRSAHAKRCGKAYNITPKELLKLMETQQRICNAKKHHNMVHTKAPVPVKKEVLPAKLKGAPNSPFEEDLQLARALSTSMITKANDENCDASPQIKRVFDPNEKKRKRPRSYAVVELAPRTCKCEVLQRIHDRFLAAFRIRKTDGTSVSHAEICNDLAIRTTAFMQQQARLLEKLDRLERLSQDMHRLVEEESLADIRIQCVDGSVNGHRCLLHARTSLMCKPSQTACQSVEINESEKVVKYWLQYVYSGRVEWEKDDTVRIQKIAEQYGPDDLLPLCTRMLTSRHLEPKRAVSAISATNSSSIPDFYGTSRGMDTGTTERASQPTSVPQSDVRQHSLSTAVIPNELAVKLTSSSAADKSDITMDYEDPLQGLSLADTSEDGETNNQSVTIDNNDGCSRDAAGEVHVLESCPSEYHDDVIDLTSPERGVTSQSATQSYMEITLFDVAVTDHSDAPTNGNSPDIFEDKSKDGCAAVSKPTWNFTPQRRSSSLCKVSSSSRLSISNRLSSSALHNVAVLRNGEHERELNKASEASFKPLITIHSESSKIDVCDAEVVCLDEVAEQDRKSTSKDPYESEYFNYYDSFVEQWYEPVDDSASNQVNYELKVPHESFREGNQQCITEATADSASTGSSTKSLIASPSEQVGPVVNRNVGRFPIGVSSQDSFFDTPKFIANAKPDLVNPSSFAENNHSVDLAPPAAHSTPLQPTRKKPRFGSNVKILKTTDITPMPDYDSMNDECLKNELRKFGLKPMGRKRSIAILKKIYAEIHPEIDPSTPTIRPLVVDDIEDHEQQAPKCKSTKSRTRGQAIRTLPEAMRIADLPPAASRDAQIGSMEENEDEDFIDLGDKTLNDPTDEPPEESMIDDGLLPKDLESMTRTFLNWLQSPENEELYNHLLSLQPVLLDELHLRMSRADTAVCCIPKKTLANILDHLGVTFSLSQINGGRRLTAPRKAVLRK